MLENTVFEDVLDRLENEPHTLVNFEVYFSPFFDEQRLLTVAIPTQMWETCNDYIKDFAKGWSSEDRVELTTFSLDESLKEVVQLYTSQSIKNEYHSPDELVRYLNDKFQEYLQTKYNYDGTDDLTYSNYYYEYWLDSFLRRKDVNDLGLTRRVFYSS